MPPFGLSLAIGTPPLNASLSSVAARPVNFGPSPIAPPRFRYTAIDPRDEAHRPRTGRWLLSRPLRQRATRAAPTPEAAAPALSGGEAERLLGLRPGAPYAEDKKALHALLDDVDVHRNHDPADTGDLRAGWWARLREYRPAYAVADLQRVRSNLRSIFFDAPPASRPGLWRQMSQAARRDLNLMVAIADAVNGAARADAGTVDASSYPRIADAVREDLKPDGSMPASDMPYLLALSQTLRDHGLANHTFFENRLELLPSDAHGFAAAIDAPPAADAPYFQQRRQDLAALGYLLLQKKSGVENERLTLPALRGKFEAALEAEMKDERILSQMFAGPRSADDIYHDGMTLRNAAGKSVSDLIDYLDRRNASDFAQLHAAHKITLMRRKLYRLQEHPDYPVGSATQSMATILMRMSDQPLNRRYRRYDGKLQLLECWELRNQQWIARRDFVMSPELYNAMHLEGANDLAVSGLYWYRDVWDTQIFQAIMNTPPGRGGDREGLAEVWRWLAERAPGWQASGRGWAAIAPEQFADSVTAAADALYQIQQAKDLPRFEFTDIYGAGHTQFHSSLMGLRPEARAALDAVAKQFDFSLFFRERVLADNWLSTSYRLLDKSYYRTMLELQPPPSYSVEIEAYLTLFRNGITAEQMLHETAQIICDVDLSRFHARPRPPYEAFIAVIRNPHRDARLLLSNGKTIYPHHIINESFDAYRKHIDKHPWVIGHAWQNLRDRGLPFLPSLLNKEIEAIARPLRQKASKATESGTQMADRYFGALPITAPLLHISRSVRDDHYGNVPYYTLILARDIIAAVALAHAIGAAYISPLVSAARYGSSALLAATAVPRTYRIHSAGYIDLKPRPSRRQSKPHEITLTGDQTRGLQNKVVRTRNQGNAARQYSTSHTPDNATLLASVHRRHFDPEDWQKMMQLMLPANEEEEFRQQQNILKIGTQNEHSLLNITISEHIEDAGARAGLLGLSEVDAFTQCDGQILGERATVQRVFDWMLKATNYRMRPMLKLLDDNLRVAYADGVPAAWESHPDWRYDPADIVSQAYIGSARFRSLFNWHDDHSIEKQSLRVTLDLACKRATVTRTASSSIAAIRLPADPHNLPFVMDEIHIRRQTIRQAIVESMIEAFIGPHTLSQPMRNRGAVIWLSNQVLLQEGRRFDPRINAVFLDAPQPGLRRDQRSIRRIAELEDQYLERIGVKSQFDPRAMYQEQDVRQRPTVEAVTALLERLNYRAHWHEQKQPPKSDALTRADFLQRFRRGFVVDEGSCAVADTELIDLFFCECYSGSSLFRRLFDVGIAQLARRWTIFPNGFDGDGAPDEDMLIPAEGLINARAENAVYLGLIEVEPGGDNTSVSLPVRQLPPLEPFRRMLDGVVAALSGDLGTPSRHAAYRHRGATVWASDVVTWQAGWPANKRLARVALSASNADQAAQLLKLAGANRRAARIEDTYIVHSLNRQPKTSR
ncbi:MAG: hypothetical protein JWP38_1011 [Herbaspirillum sp.]|jgi:hypothetical protein|nr:hypothetical protein [Herbaspirillum sp.]